MTLYPKTAGDDTGTLVTQEIEDWALPMADMTEVMKQMIGAQWG